ncbi:hypothetical protein EDL98_01860 [Ornithobacterium rhinotracheale]|nr:hypothetical protein [Ornithobacterium rhinotracheale]
MRFYFNLIQKWATGQINRPNIEMERYEEIKRILAENPNGVTIDLNTMQEPEDKFWCVALKETQNNFTDEDLKKVIETAKKTTNIVGGGRKNGKFYLDAVMLVGDEEEATRMGIENGQIAIFNLATRQSKRLID